MNLHDLSIAFNAVAHWMVAARAYLYAIHFDTFCQRLACWLFTLPTRKGATRD